MPALREAATHAKLDDASYSNIAGYEATFGNVSNVQSGSGRHGRVSRAAEKES